MANYIPQIRYDDCYGCKACLYNCPVSLFTLSYKVTRRGMRRELPAPTRIEDCIGCGVCSRACPVEAIDMVKTPAEEGKEAIYMDWDAPVRIDPNKCIGCTACARVCPSNAIKGTVKNPHVIDEDQCIRCGLCMTKCKKDAIYNTNDPIPALLPKAEAPKAAPKAEAPKPAPAPVAEPAPAPVAEPAPAPVVEPAPAPVEDAPKVVDLSDLIAPNPAAE